MDGLHMDTLAASKIFYMLWVVGFILMYAVVCTGGQYDNPFDSFTMQNNYNRTFSRHLTYCNHHYRIRGEEGHSPIGYTLTGVHIVITPGESNALHNKGQGHKPYHVCSISSDPFSTVKIQSFQETANIYRMVQTERHGFKEFHPVFDEQCSKEHLTDTGFKQLIATGEHLYTSYFNQLSLDKLLPESLSIHAESVPNQKSYQSTLAVLHGMLSEKNFVHTKVHKTPDNLCDTADPDLISCRCGMMNDLMPHIMQAIDEGKYMFKDRIPEIDKLRELFGEYRDDGLSALQLFKAMRQAKCNGASTVCDHHDKCYDLTHQIELELTDMASRFLNQLFSDRTFRQFSGVAAYPLLQRLVHSISTESESLRLYTGTEHYLEFLKTSLGIYRNTLLPVASRFVFEMYQKDGNQQNDDEHYVRVGNQLNDDERYVRVLLNGKDVTGQVKGCSGGLEKELCSSTDFKSLVSELKRQYTQEC